MAETTQVNLRIPTLLIHDLEFIAQNLKVSKTEWLKIKIAEIISKERARILEDIDYRYEQGRIEDKEYKELSGLAPSSTLKTNRKHALKLKIKGIANAKKHIYDIAKEITKNQLREEGEEFARKYLQDASNQLNNDQMMLDLLKHLVKYQGTPVPMVEFVSEAEKQGISGDTLKEVFENLKRKNYIKEKDGEIILTTKIK